MLPTPETSAGIHIPVMLQEVINHLQPQDSSTYIDATFGRGSYSRKILDACANCQVIAIDRDPEAADCAARMAYEYPGRFKFIQARFSELSSLCHQHHIENIAGIVFDVGVSSPQIDQEDRGFSFSKDGPLDMRMEKQGVTAADVVNTYGEKELADIIYYYGEERCSRRIARKICEVRQDHPLQTTSVLAQLVRSVVPPSRDGLDTATRTFQALRIYVNDELDELQKGLEAALDILEKDGRLITVAFHSLEDRIIKNFFREKSEATSAISRHLPVQQSKNPVLRILTRKTVNPTEEEIRKNPRARSARLRAAEKIVQRK